MSYVFGRPFFLFICYEYDYLYMKVGQVLLTTPFKIGNQLEMKRKGKNHKKLRQQKPNTYNVRIPKKIFFRFLEIVYPV